MTTMTTERLGETVGAQIVGLDRDRILEDESLAAPILEALDANGVLVFRDLFVDDDAQVAFSQRLGRCETFRLDPVHPEIFRITLDPAKNPSAQYLRGTFFWHIDGLTEDIPIMATILSAKAVAESGGETEFASTYQAYDDLTEDEKQRFESVRVVHTIEASQRLFNHDPTPQEVETWRKRPSKEHPLVWRHDSGRRSLVLGATADHVVGMDPDEGRAFLDGLLDRATAPNRVYRHAWQLGDMVIWDNRGVLHRAAPYDPSSPRDMHRTTLFGEEPVQ
jgi:alpha-ketoglutarate-dependent taurine dioxygenase